MKYNMLRKNKVKIITKKKKIVKLQKNVKASDCTIIIGVIRVISNVMFLKKCLGLSQRSNYFNLLPICTIYTVAPHHATKTPNNFPSNKRMTLILVWPCNHFVIDI